MTYTEHTPVKPEKVVGVAAAALEQSLVIPAVFTREGIDKFRGAKDDTVNVVVEGLLPYRTYGWRNDRSTAIQYDTYSEKKVAMTFGDDIYSGVQLTDEQATMDFDGWGKLATKQVEAVGRGLEHKAVKALESAPYEVQVQLDEANMRGSLIRLKAVFDKLRVAGSRKILVDDDLEVALLDDDKLQLASNVGEGEAVSALREATLGRRYGFDFVKANELPSGEAYGIFQGGYVFLTAAPAVPQSVAFGATASYNGVALRWIRAFDIDHGVEKSVFMAYQDFDFVKDNLLVQDLGKPEGQQFSVTDNQHFVRGVKISVGTGYKVEVANSELANASGIQSTDGTNDGSLVA